MAALSCNFKFGRNLRAAFKKLVEKILEQVPLVEKKPNSADYLPKAVRDAAKAAAAVGDGNSGTAANSGAVAANGMKSGAKKAAPTKKPSGVTKKAPRGKASRKA